ncbi:hypothetical protein AVEN_273141-1 [Araneus ventricosus]|uniref:Uncharacterized protein n=1 Tax=Araneus ventricosus TaxID=182803 RepID=A0A4Y2SQS6_ARAVE|nr:hypothetical protein AVEN_273141-1 [Araneus ventricosus]
MQSGMSDRDTDFFLFYNRIVVTRPLTLQECGRGYDPRSSGCGEKGRGESGRGYVPKVDRPERKTYFLRCRKDNLEELTWKDSIERFDRSRAVGYVCFQK